MNEGRRALAVVTGVVVAAIGLGVLISSQTSSSSATGPMPNTSTARLVEAAVVQSEKQYLAQQGSPHPTVSYVVTTAAQAWRFLTNIKWERGYTNSGVIGPVMTTLPPPGVTTEPAPINLLKDREPVALVELSGVPVYLIPIVPGGALCINGCTTTPPPPPAAWEADDAFVVVNLDNGNISGGEMATPPPGTSFSLSNFGTVTSWTGPSDFGRLQEPVTVEPLSSPSFWYGTSTTTASGS